MVVGLKKSIEGFEVLDDYIRGRSAATTKKAKAAHSALKHAHAVTDAKAQFQHGKDKQPGTSSKTKRRRGWRRNGRSPFDHAEKWEISIATIRSDFPIDCSGSAR